MYEEKANEIMKEMVKTIHNLRKDMDIVISLEWGTKDNKNELNTVANNLYNAEITLNKISN